MGTWKRLPPLLGQGSMCGLLEWTGREVQRAAWITSGVLPLHVLIVDARASIWEVKCKPRGEGKEEARSPSMRAMLA